MNPFLSLSRAAHLLGVTRASLQNKIREGVLNSFDGQISLSEIRSVFPELEIEDSGAFERVNDIKHHAFGRRLRERALPSQEILAQRIFQQSEELEEARRHLQQYHTLVQSILDRLAKEPGAQTQGGSASPANSASFTNSAISANFKPSATLAESWTQSLRQDIEQRLGSILASEADNALGVMHNMLKMVSAQVTVRPSGHEFIVDGNDTLLQAGLKAGLRLDYGCGSGNCGLCKTRIISGEVRQIAPADYLLSEAERASGHVLSCVCAPVSDIVIETLEASGPQDIPTQEIVATVRKICEPTHPEAPYLLHLQTPRSNRLRFLAGQSVTLGLRTPSGDIAGSFPIASCPCDDRNLHFHIASDAKDPIARALQAGWIKVTDSINLRGPQGEFTLDPESPRPLVFLCCDTGFGPIKSLIEHAMAIDRNDTFGLVWIAPEGAHYLDNQCRMWADAFDRFIYRRLSVQDTKASRQFDQDARQVLNEARATLPYLADADIFVAGPAEFVDALSQNADVKVLRSCIT